MIAFSIIVAYLSKKWTYTAFHKFTLKLSNLTSAEKNFQAEKLKSKTDVIHFTIRKVEVLDIIVIFMADLEKFFVFLTI